MGTTVAARESKSAPVLTKLSAPNIFHPLIMILLFSHYVGKYYDASNHIHYGFNIETFFNPNHYWIYGNWFAISLLIALYLIRARARPNFRLLP